MGARDAEIARKPRQRESVTARQHDVENGELKILRGEQLLAVGEVFRGHDLVAGVAQIDGHQLAHQPFVFDDGDAVNHARLPREPTAAWIAAPR